MRVAYGIVMGSQVPSLHRYRRRGILRMGASAAACLFPTIGIDRGGVDDAGSVYRLHEKV